VNLGNLAGEFVTLQPAASDYPLGGYALVGGETANTNSTPNLINVDLWRILTALPVGSQGGLTPVWNSTTQKVQIFGEGPNVGVFLSLGPVSAAKSTTIGVTGTPASLVTVAIANNLVAGQFVYLNSFTAGAALNGSIVQVVTASATGFTAYAPGQANITAATADITGTYQLVDAGVGNNLTTGTPILVTNGACTSASPSIMTMTVANTFVPGQFVVLQGFTQATLTPFNGVIAQILTASTAQFTANWYYTGGALNAAETTGTVSLLVTNGNAPVSLEIAAPASTNSTLVAPVAGTSPGTVTIAAKNTLVAGNIIVLQGFNQAAQMNGSVMVVQPATYATTTVLGWHLTGAVGSAADLTGTISLLVTGTPTGLSTASGELQAGTDLSGYAFQLLLLGY
jgi:hypothetical protein